jgi:hypothetical protein
MKMKALFTAALLMLACAAHATRMSPLSIEQLTAKAQLVLHGRVVSKTVQRDATGRIHTKIQLQITDTWKGQPKANPFTIVQAGGVLGEEVATVDGQEEFLIGEEVVVFLVVNERGEGVVIGIVQGKFKVARDASGEKVTHNIFHGIAPGHEQRPNEKGKVQSLTLGQLKQRVQGGRP